MLTINHHSSVQIVCLGYHLILRNENEIMICGMYTLIHTKLNMKIDMSSNEAPLIKSLGILVEDVTSWKIWVMFRFYERGNHEQIDGVKEEITLRSYDLENEKRGNYITERLQSCRSS